MVPGLEARLMESSEDEVIHIADLVHHAYACQNDTHFDLNRSRKAPMVQGPTIRKA